jgi:hypothetical protein
MGQHDRQPQHASVDETAPRGVGDQQFGDRLVRAVRGLWRACDRVVHRFGQRAAERGDRAREQQPRRRGLAAAALQQPHQRHHVGVDAALVVGLRLQRQRRGQVENRVVRGVEQRVEVAGIAQVAAAPVHVRAGTRIAGGDRCRGHVRQHQRCG